MSYRSWLLLQDSPNEDLEILLKDLGLLARLDLTGRPAVALRLRDGEAVLSAPDLDAFFDQVFENRVVEGFSTAPVEQLRAMHRKVFFHRARFVQLQCQVDGVSTAAQPYVRRMVRFEYLVSSVQGDFDTALTRVEADDFGQSFPILIDPLPVDIDDKHIFRVFGQGAISLSGINGVFLPPGRNVGDGYFSEDHLKLREGLEELPGLNHARRDEPCALALWRLVHDPLTRDFLQEGASLHFTHEEGKPTRLRLEIFDSDRNDPVAMYRMRTLLQPETMPGAPWAAAVARSIRSDLESLGPEGLAISIKSGEPTTWKAGVGRSYEASYLAEGSWQRLESLRSELSETELRRRFDELVLWPSRTRGDGGPDHDLAERQFIANYWHCPWSSTTDRGPWRYAMLELLRNELSGIGSGPEDRVQGWSEDGWPWIERDRSDTMLVVVHRPTTSDSELQLWRLLLPVGAVLKSGGAIRLNDVSARLNRGYVLA